MSNDQNDESNVASSAAISLYHLVAAVGLDPTIPHHLKVVEIWNRLCVAEAAQLVRLRDNSGAAKSRIGKNYTKLRYYFEKANQGYFDEKVERGDNGLLRLKVVPLSAEKLEPKATEPKKAAPVSGTKPVPKAPDTSKLSPTERALLLGTTVEELGATPLNDDERAEIQRAAEEANALLKKQQDFVEWACRRADAEADLLRTKTGEALWTDAVTVESFPADPTMRIVFVRSSTAPLFGTHGPSVKHDFRANGVPVTVNHDLMFRQLDNQRLIRSRVIRTNFHEYYVKALKYQEDMYLKGYFRADGEDRHNLTRHYVVSGGKVRQVTDAEYREYENRAASRKKK